MSAGSLPSGGARCSRAEASLSKIESPASRRRILIVDDDASVAQTITRILARDYDVTAVDRALDAVALLTRGVHFDAILCEVKLPAMTGEDLYARLEQELPEICAKIVFLTAGVVTAAERAFLEAAGCPWLEKPFAVVELRRVVAAVVA